MSVAPSSSTTDGMDNELLIWFLLNELVVDLPFVNAIELVTEVGIDPALKGMFIWIKDDTFVLCSSKYRPMYLTASACDTLGAVENREH